VFVTMNIGFPPHPDRYVASAPGATAIPRRNYRHTPRRNWARSTQFHIKNRGV